MQGGSSGSGLWAPVGDGQYLIGVLTGGLLDIVGTGCPDFFTPQLTGYFGRFDRIYERARPWLGPVDFSIVPEERVSTSLVATLVDADGAHVARPRGWGHGRPERFLGRGVRRSSRQRRCRGHRERPVQSHRPSVGRAHQQRGAPQTVRRRRRRRLAIRRIPLAGEAIQRVSSAMAAPGRASTSGSPSPAGRPRPPRSPGSTSSTRSRKRSSRPLRRAPRSPSPGCPRTGSTSAPAAPAVRPPAALPFC